MSKYTQVYNSTPWYVIVHVVHAGQMVPKAIAPGGTLTARSPEIAWAARYRFEPMGDDGLQIVEAL